MKIGDKVVCIDDRPCICGSLIGLIKNSVYVIEGFDTHENGLPVVRLIGFKPACSDNHLFPRGHADARRFRLLNDLKNEAAAKNCVLSAGKKLL